ncbi:MULTISPECIES: putative glycolipid-binding domain-containing protein [Sphingobacterium]|uniref:putative glycolipid-binding domain-containing protein n=1 Tax=Sphingobacterium TaxID=28453 RepID=UPI0035E3CC68
MVNGKNRRGFNGLVFIDICIILLNNTFPINNLHLTIGEAREIVVLYFNIVKNEIKRVRQRYLRGSKYE